MRKRFQDQEYRCKSGIVIFVWRSPKIMLEGFFKLYNTLLVCSVEMMPKIKNERNYNHDHHNRKRYGQKIRN